MLGSLYFCSVQVLSLIRMVVIVGIIMWKIRVWIFYLSVLTQQLYLMFLVNIRRRLWLLGKKDVAGFVRDFVPNGLACLMIEPPETQIVKLFLLKTLFLVGLGRWRVSGRSIYIISLISFLVCIWLNRNLLLESKFARLHNCQTHCC